MEKIDDIINKNQNDVLLIYQIDRLYTSLIDFVKANDFELILYQNYSNEFALSFTRYYNKLELKESKLFVLDIFSENRSLVVDMAVDYWTGNVDRFLEKKYLQMKELVSNRLSSIIDAQNPSENKPHSDKKNLKEEYEEIEFLKTFKNNFDNTPEGEVYSHFKKGLVDKNYIEIGELIKYLISAFEKNKPNKTFTLKDLRYKKDVIKGVFYEYYKDCRNKGRLTSDHTKNYYSKLFLNYFIGFDSDSQFNAN